MILKDLIFLPKIMTRESLICEFKKLNKHLDSLELYEYMYEYFDNFILRIKNDPDQSVAKEKILSIMITVRGFLELSSDKYNPEEDDRKLIINLIKSVVKKVLKDPDFLDSKLLKENTLTNVLTPETQ